MKNWEEELCFWVRKKLGCCKGMKNRRTKEIYDYVSGFTEIDFWKKKNWVLFGLLFLVVLMILLMLLLFLVVLMLLFLLNDESYRRRDEGEIRKEFIIIFLIFSLFNNKNDMCKLKKIKKKIKCHICMPSHKK
ncbi:unnamed protein product [Trifolium pratense]|uniref:Uncharacterized protein n=1 Tax=Trifolium pratense TaxID=57577 RepID=A0ACB0IZJ4_TRIPR|nr:unnamed protein product [Trifolium pratense]